MSCVIINISFQILDFNDEKWFQIKTLFAWHFIIIYIILTRNIFFTDIWWMLFPRAK